MKIHEGSSVAVIAKYSVLQITLSLLYLTSEIETKIDELCWGVYSYTDTTLYPLRDHSQ